jgi:signal transduction histidine kinase
MVGDTVLTLVVALLSFGQLLTTGMATPLWVKIVTFLLMLGPLIVRRRYPVPAAAVVLLGGAMQLFAFRFTGDPKLDPGVLYGMDIALGIMLYTLVVYASRRITALYLFAVTAEMVAFVLWRVDTDMAYQGVTVAVMLAFCWILGEFVGARRAYHAEVEQRLALLETERDQQAKIAVAEERTRIARELHDVVAHAVSVIVVQADGAAYAVESNPELAAKAVRTIAATGRDALAELRRLLGVLREEGTEGDDRAPQPGAESLRSLTEKVQLAGLPVRLTCDGDLAELPTGLSLGIYRIVQEALTNSLKHAGPGARAAVTVNRRDDLVTLEVVDSGMHEVGTPIGVSGGNGLIGMRERVGVYGGTLDAGPHPNGGWRVHAELPIASEPG